jgi:hypothetical protein
VTAVFTVQLHCARAKCKNRFPDQPEVGTAREMRKRAAAAGWQVQQHTVGEDVCPSDRIREISEAAGLTAERPTSG